MLCFCGYKEAPIAQKHGNVKRNIAISEQRMYNIIGMVFNSMEGGVSMAYSAMSIAKFIISHCYKEKRPVSNLKLQKIMYYAWVDYYNETQQPLYNDNICAWQLGPVIPEVYYEFCSFAGTPITREYTSELTEADARIMERIITPYMSVTAGTLVNRTHKQGGPWDVVYRGGIGVRDVIPFSLIKRLECEN